jgi:hypothetical protein
MNRACAAVRDAGLAFKILDEHVETTSGYVSISTMHLAKGLEFRAVIVMACDDEIIPLQERIETVGDDADLQEVLTIDIAAESARAFLQRHSWPTLPSLRLSLTSAGRVNGAPL